MARSTRAYRPSAMQITGGDLTRYVAQELQRVAETLLPLTRPDPVRLPAYTTSTKPLAADYPYCMVAIKDAALANHIAYSDGTNWRSVQTGAVIT